MRLVNWLLRRLVGAPAAPPADTVTFRVADPDEARMRLAALCLERDEPMTGEVDWDADGKGGTVVARPLR